MIITRYLFREILATFAGVALVLMLMASSAQLVGIFTKVADGTIKADTVMSLFGIYSITTVPFILPLSIYLAVLITLGRLYRESEMAALAACGYGPFQLLRPVLIVAVLVAIVQGLFTLFLAPWADGQGGRMEALQKSSVDIQGITPGRFRPIPMSKGIIYVETINEDRTRIGNIFASLPGTKGNTTIIARAGQIKIDAQSGDRFLELSDGYRYEGIPGKDNFSLIQFERHAIRLETSRLLDFKYRYRSLPSIVLLKAGDRASLAEFQWRLSSALFCIVLAVLALPMSKTSPRQGRYTRMVLAVVLYLLLSNLLNVARSWVSEGTVSPVIGMWWVHVSALLAAIGLILYQNGARYYLYRFLPRNPRRGAC